ncbi:PEGA domain-containing protein, partial [Candidatus Saccharibacteria bacterium]|nr:PEGA domain-containing protein [Candidatus Saccharibacteria bacterium]
MLRLNKLFVVVVGVIAFLLFVALLGSALITSPAALSVSSNPSEQKVYLDGQEMGTTPFSNKNLKEGE